MCPAATPATAPLSLLWCFTTGACCCACADALRTAVDGLGGGDDHPGDKAKTCDADKRLKYPRVHDENDDWSSEQGEQSDNNYTGK